MQSPTVLVTAKHLVPEAQKILADAGARVEFMEEPIDEAALARRLAVGDVAAVILRGSKPFTRNVLLQARGLKIIAKNGAGVDSVDLRSAEELGIAVAVAPGANADAVAEHALALMLALIRDLHTLDRTLKGGGWEGTSWLGRDFRDARVGILGYGSIGRRTARLAAALGAQVSVFSASRAHADEFERVDDLHEFLSRLDILSIHCPLTPNTHGLIGDAEIGAMKTGAFIVNTARGPIVDEKALVAALRSGKLAGAGLDTFEVEPIPAGHALLSLPNVILTPHVAGVTRNAALRVATVTARNVVDAIHGVTLPPGHLVTGAASRAA